MDIEVNWVGVVAAGLSTLVVGSVWYTPKVFGDTWMRLARIDKKKAEQRNAGAMIGIAVGVSFITAYVLAHVTYLSNAYFGHSFLQDALTTAFWMWLGFTAVRIITHDLFEGRPAKLTAITVAHELVTFLIMGLVIGLFEP